MTRERIIETGIDAAVQDPSMWRVYAECADELTEVMLIGVQGSDLLQPEQSEDLQRRVLDLHKTQCASCASWQRLS